MHERERSYSIFRSLYCGIERDDFSMLIARFNEWGESGLALVLLLVCVLCPAFLYFQIMGW